MKNVVNSVNAYGSHGRPMVIPSRAFASREGRCDGQSKDVASSDAKCHASRPDEEMTWAASKVAAATVGSGYRTYDAVLNILRQTSFHAGWLKSVEPARFSNESVNNTVNCWDPLKPLCHNATGNGQRDGLKNMRMKSNDFNGQSAAMRSERLSAGFNDQVQTVASSDAKHSASCDQDEDMVSTTVKAVAASDGGIDPTNQSEATRRHLVWMGHFTSRTRLSRSFLMRSMIVRLIGGSHDHLQVDEYRDGAELHRFDAEDIGDAHGRPSGLGCQGVEVPLVRGDSPVWVGGV